MQEHRASAAAAADGDVLDGAAAARAVQAGVVLALFEMAAWRWETSLKDAKGRAALAAAVESRLAPRELASAASRLRWLVSLQPGAGAPSPAPAAAPAAACVALLGALSDGLNRSADPALGRPRWAVLRFLANAASASSALGDISAVHAVPSAAVRDAVDALASGGYVVVHRQAGDEATTAALSPAGARAALCDPLAGAAERAARAFSADELFGLMRLARCFGT